MMWLWWMSLVGAWSLLMIPPAGAEQASSKSDIQSVSASNNQSARAIKSSPQPAKTVTDWIAQIEASLVQITGVRVEATEAGSQVVIETADGVIASPESRVEGNALILNISNAKLNLVDETAVEQPNPVVGIAVIRVTALAEDQVQLEIVGTTAPPVADIQSEGPNLVVNISPGSEIADDFEEEELEITVTATRTETASQDVPQSIQVIPQEVIEDREVNKITDALRVVPGIQNSVPNSLFNRLTIRGFGADERRNGLNSNAASGANVLTSNIERIEVLKGPASVLYGQGSFGGTVNLITKQPTDEPFYKVDLALGNFDLYQGAVDFSGPIDKSGTVKYRFNAAAATEGSFIDSVDSLERFLVNPVLSWQISDKTEVTFEFEYTNLTADNNFGLPARGTILDNINGEIDRSRYIGDADFEKREVDTIRAGYNLEHRFNDNWRLRNAFQFTRYSSPELSIFEFGLLDDQRTLERGFNITEKFNFNGYLLDTYLVGNFNTGSIEHELTAGIELSRRDEFGYFFGGPASSIDLFAPENDTLSFGPVDFVFDFKSSTDTLGIYLQDKIELLDNLILLLGGRFDVISASIDDFSSNTTSSQQDEEFSPRVGIVYKPIEDLSLYASYSQSFIPNLFGFTSTGENFEPQRGTQFEVGTKFNISNKLALTLAYFDISVTNVPTTDPEDVNFQVITGEQKSRGFELYASGEILPGWNVIGGYTFNDAKITEDTDIPIGNRIPNNPKHAVSLFTTYQIQQGDLEGLGFGLGLFYVGEREGDFANSFEVPSYMRTDASIFYKRGKFRAALNFKNLFNIDYFENVESDLRVRFGAPFTVIGSVSWTF